MTHFLDTNAVIAILKNDPVSVRGRLRRVASRRAEIAISTIVFHELWFGVANSEHKRENAERLRVFLAGNIAVVPFEEEDAQAAGELRAELEKAGKPIGPYDLLIAAQALRNGERSSQPMLPEFARVRGLAWQDWSRKK